jgi:hypothetical protein
MRYSLSKFAKCLTSFYWVILIWCGCFHLIDACMMHYWMFSNSFISHLKRYQWFKFIDISMCLVDSISIKFMVIPMVRPVNETRRENFLKMSMALTRPETVAQQPPKSQPHSRVLWLDTTNGYESTLFTCSHVHYLVVGQPTLSWRSWAWAEWHSPGEILCPPRLLEFQRGRRAVSCVFCLLSPWFVHWYTDGNKIMSADRPKSRNQTKDLTFLQYPDDILPK